MERKFIQTREEHPSNIMLDNNGKQSKSIVESNRQASCCGLLQEHQRTFYKKLEALSAAKKAWNTATGMLGKKVLRLNLAGKFDKTKDTQSKLAGLDKKTFMDNHIKMNNPMSEEEKIEWSLQLAVEGDYEGTVCDCEIATRNKKLAQASGVSATKHQDLGQGHGRGHLLSRIIQIVPLGEPTLDCVSLDY